MYAPVNWPDEYVTEYFPLLNRFSYKKVSLQQITVETEITSCVDLFFAPLPPVCSTAIRTRRLISFSVDIDIYPAGIEFVIHFCSHP